VHRKKSTHARSTHCDPIDAVGLFDRAPIVRDDYELRLLGPLFESGDEPLDVRLIQRRIDFVKDAEGGWSYFQQSEEQGDRRQCAFAAGEQAKRRDPLARWLGADIDTSRSPRSLRSPFLVVAGSVFSEQQFRLSDAEHELEVVPKRRIDLLAGLPEFAINQGLQFAFGLEQR